MYLTQTDYCILKIVEGKTLSDKLTFLFSIFYWTIIDKRFPYWDQPQSENLGIVFGSRVPTETPLSKRLNIGKCKHVWYSKRKKKC